MQIRVGNGYDVHRFADQAKSDGAIVLGGVSIPHSHTLLAHSDGDVLVHALCDALLGALALGDIGQHFPDTDARYRNISSLELLAHVCSLIDEQGWQLGNADMTVVAQAPKLAPHTSAMRNTLAQVCKVLVDCISIKATTTEGLGFTGRQEGIACYASVLLMRKS